MSAPLNTDVIEAAGGIVEAATSPGPLIAVVYRERYGGEWGLPKGKRQAGESWEDTALREVQEEIGLTPVIVGVAGATAYLAAGVPKLVLYWRMRVEHLREPFTPNEEVTKLTWLTPERAIERLTHRAEADLVRRVFGRDSVDMRRPMAYLNKYLVPILQYRRWKRLASVIVVYDQELRGRAQSSSRLADGLATIQEALRSASTALENGDIDQGWKCLFNAQRLELLYLYPDELDAAAMAMRHEADKLNGWRKAAVVGLLTVKDCENQRPNRVFRAALIRDEHYNNEAYKDGLRRGVALRLAVVLVATLLALLWLSAYLGPTFSDNNLFATLRSMAMVGLLGATISAMTDTPRLGSTRIPEMASSIRVTLLRLLIGPASAIVLYFVIQSNFYSAVFRFGQPNGYAILVIAFAAGFSERLVLRVVETIAGKT